MARIRTIKPEFWDDEELANIAMPARLLFIGLWNFADDFGIILGSAKYIKGKVFPYDTTRTEQVQIWLDALIKSRMLVSFSCLGKDYYVIRTFREHQLIDKRYTKTILPNTISVDEILAGLDLEQNHTSSHVNTRESSVVSVSVNGSVNVNGEDSKCKKEKVVLIPPLDEVLEYSKVLVGIKYESLKFSIEMKYNSWVENGWRDGYNTKIVNWKSKLGNAIPFLKESPKQAVAATTTTTTAPKPFIQR